MKLSLFKNLTQYPKFTIYLPMLGSFLEKFSSYFKAWTILYVFLRKDITLPWFHTNMRSESQRLELMRPKCAQNLQKIANTPICNAMINILFNVWKAYLWIMISFSKGVTEPISVVKNAKNCLKITKSCIYSYWQCNNLKTLKSFWKYFCVVFGKEYLCTMISSQKMLIKPTARVSKAKVRPNNVEIHKYFYLQWQKIKYYYILQLIFVVFWENISAYHDFKKKSAHRNQPLSKQAKNLPKNCQILQIFLPTMQ